jgi:hypothetical protein
MITLSTLLGPSQYKTVTYTWEGRAAQPAHLFPMAADELFAPKKLVVFLTPQVKENKNFQDLQTRLQEKLWPVDIPKGRSEADLWEIFERVAGAVGEGESVILDITNAFCSIPMIVFAAVAYLQRTKNVTIERIVYGAYEAREPF